MAGATVLTAKNSAEFVFQLALYLFMEHSHSFFASSGRLWESYQGILFLLLNSHLSHVLVRECLVFKTTTAGKHNLRGCIVHDPRSIATKVLISIFQLYVIMLFCKEET